ncbi:hypothetical protein NE237_027331 [Protea cynaroides]|uniref:ferric-chelate reductase (NADH) n=1 Tax=Protea cynaroides TaxID=273540 RepID=A0A9Q0GRN5_9MAGN|nr:hypothetical protein NE237_027331 [Protea cynaroides]
MDRESVAAKDSSNPCCPSLYDGRNKNIRAALKGLIMVVFLSWFITWVMLPTKTYKNNWIPKLKIKANSTYLGGQGINLLLFTFPMMLVAVLGCVYLHLVKKFDSTSTQRLNSRTGMIPRHRSWRLPMFVNASLGIVTTMELAFSVMFIALLFWSFANYLCVSFGHLHMHKAGEKVWEAKFRSVSLRLGYVGNICWAFLFFPVTRASSILPLVGLTSESTIKFHIWLGHLSMILFTAHSVGFIIYWAMTNQMALMLEWSKTWVSNVAGEIAFVFALVMWATSFAKVRRKMFELFFYAHHLYILCIFFYVLHVGIAYFCLILPGVFLFIIDRYLRFLQSLDQVRVVSARLLRYEATELNFFKSPGLKYNPTSTVFINVPSISKLQWHPFTVTSNCNTEPDKLSIVIKSTGSWSQKLNQTLSSPSSPDHLEVSIEGPYGPTSSQFLRHDLLVMLSGGSGITPFASIIREIIFRRTTPGCHTPRILLICSFKHSIELSMLDLLLPFSDTPLDVSHLDLQIEAYITREKENPTTDTQNSIQAIYFKPNPSDKPVSPVLGPNSSLWLSAIISASFVMFLLFLGILTRYYIYPIDHNTDMIYHFSFRALWDMFFICICIVMVATVVFLLHKKQHTMEGKQIQDMDMPTPITSPGIYNVNQEIESLPHQSLAEATKVHFGSRPDFKKILFECKEHSVGVFVCGPRKMRHEVAKICSAGLVDNLHFESISFNW